MTAMSSPLYVVNKSQISLVRFPFYPSFDFLSNLRLPHQCDVTCFRIFSAIIKGDCKVVHVNSRLKGLVPKSTIPSLCRVGDLDDLFTPSVKDPQVK